MKDKTATELKKSTIVHKRAENKKIKSTNCQLLMINPTRSTEHSIKIRGCLTSPRLK